MQETQAAGDLAKWLHEISAADFPVLQEGGGPIEGGVISLGDTALMRAAGLPAVDSADNVGGSGLEPTTILSFTYAGWPGLLASKAHVPKVEESAWG